MILRSYRNKVIDSNNIKCTHTLVVTVETKRVSNERARKSHKWPLAVDLELGLYYLQDPIYLHCRNSVNAINLTRT